MISSHRAHLLFGAAAVLALMLPTHSGLANTLTVSATVPADCSIVAGELDFGNYIANTNQPGAGSFDVTCTAAAVVRVTLDAGQHENTGNRNMERTGGTERLGYILYTDAAHSQQWTPVTVFKDVTVPNGESVPVDVFGEIPSQDPTAGEYTDIVTVSFTVQ
jgi:spore coat protein U-like protein